MHNWQKHRFAMIQRDRGRPTTATHLERANRYRDENGTYTLSDGLKPWHMRIVDFMLLNPHAKIVDIAREFGVTPVWAGQLMKTDAFREYYEQRMAEHRSLIGSMVVQKMQSVAVKSLDVMAEKLDSPDVTFGQVKEAADLALKGLGYTSNVSPLQVNVRTGDGDTTISVEQDMVSRARAKLQMRMKENSKELEHDAENYKNVTASLEVGYEEIEDAIVSSSDDN